MEKRQNPNQATDAELIVAAGENPEEFGRLMERYKDPLFHYIRRLTQQPKEDIEDLLQEVFIKIFRKLNEYDPELKFSSWAYRIAHNQVIDHFRKANVRPKTNSLDEADLAKLIKSGINIEKGILYKDCYRKVREYLDQLPLKYREVLILRFIEEKDYEEIMDILKKPKGTVATLIARGKSILEQKMKERGEECI